VAVVGLSGDDCRDALLGRECPECDAPDCVVLARVTGWQVGDALEDMPDPTGMPPSGIAYIDNSARCVLASTQAITRALLCLMDQPAGTAAPTSPTPPPTTFTHVSAISWQHAGEMPGFGLPPEQPLAIGFDGPVVAANLTQPTALMVMVSNYEKINDGEQLPLTCWCQVPITVRAFNTANPPGPIPPTTDPGWTTTVPATCTAVKVTLDPVTMRLALDVAEQDKTTLYMRIVLLGDLVADGQGRGVDANHLPPWLPKRISGDAVEGGTFESWFSVPLQATAHPPPVAGEAAQGGEASAGGGGAEAEGAATPREQPEAHAFPAAE
jgi:hypothetical protein